MENFNALLTLSELKTLYSGKPVGICPLYKGALGATGNPITIPEYKSLVKLTTKFSPKQAGTGEPTPDNVRPISGWDSVKVTVSNNSESHDYNLTLPETIYGGTVDAVTGVGSDETLFMELAIADMNNSEDFPGWKGVPDVIKCVGSGWNKPLDNEHFVLSNINSKANKIGINTNNPNNTLIFLQKNEFGLTQSQWKEQYPDLVVQFCLKLATPEPFDVSQFSIPSLRGENYFFTNGENMDIIYKETSFWG